MKPLSVEYRLITQIFPYARNSRTHSDEQVSQIASSIREFGFTNPVLIDEEGEIIAGHGRVLAASRLKMESVPCIKLNNLTDTQKRAYVIADNRIALNAGWDPKMLELELRELENSDFDLELLGFENDELAALLYPEPESEKTEGKTDPDEVPDEVEARTQPGDLYILGNHRVLCGDSTNLNDVQKLMNGEKADITFTSPPYNAGCFGFDGGKSKYKKKGDDDLDQDAYFNFLKSFTDIALEFSQYVFFNNQFLSGNRHALARFFGNYANMVKDIFPWIKNTAPPNVNKGVFTNRFEFFLCIEKGNAKKGFPVDWQGKFHNVIEGSTAAADNVAKGTHSATMPIYVPEWFLERLDFIRSVYEPFCGSGTTMIACEKNGKKCFGMEMDPHYCDVIVTRWENFTGKKAVLE